MAVVPTANYVKFIRGTPTAFENLSNKNADTLYFISENDSDFGKLYLGTKLISGNDSSSLSDLSNIVINTIKDKDLLVYNDKNEQWENTSLDNLLHIMVGATESLSGTSGLVPVPNKGEHNKFLRGDGTWVTIDIDNILTNGILDTVETKINELTTVVNNFNSVDLNNRLTILENTVNGNENIEGLLAKVENIFNAIDTKETDLITQQPITIIQKVTSLSNTINSINSRIDIVEASVRWSELSDEL